MESAVFVAAAQTAHVADFVLVEVLFQLVSEGGLRTGHQANASAAGIYFFALVFGLHKVVEGGSAVGIGLAHQKLFGYALQLLFIWRTGFLRQLSQLVKQVVIQALPTGVTP